MGNTQTSDIKSKTGKSPGKVKTLMKIRGKRGGKIEEVPFLGIVSGEHNEKQTITLNVRNDSNITETKVLPKEETNAIATSGESSSDSIFTDPLTPAGISTEMNECYRSEENIIDVNVPNNLLEFPLNNFKLNEFKVRPKEELNNKIQRLGLSKANQISLNSDPSDCFASENVICIQENRRNSCSSHIDEENCVQSFGSNEYKRHTSEPAASPEVKEGNLVMKRVVSLTLDKEALESKIFKPKFVPEKLDFKLYEKFEGYMLINWYMSEFNDNNQLRKLVQHQDLKVLATQFCTHLLAAGVLHQIPDKEVPMYNIFKPDLMYYWAHSETPASVPQTPGRLSSLSWPPTSPSPSDVFINNEVTIPVNMTQAEEQSLTKGVEMLPHEEEINKLKQEIDKYKTLMEIQCLTTNAIKDFESPDKPKYFICDRCEAAIDHYNENAQFRNEAQENFKTSTSDKSLKDQLQEDNVLEETPLSSRTRCTVGTPSIVSHTEKKPKSDSELLTPLSISHSPSSIVEPFFNIPLSQPLQTDDDTYSSLSVFTNKGPSQSLPPLTPHNDVLPQPHVSGERLPFSLSPSGDFPPIPPISLINGIPPPPPLPHLITTQLGYGLPPIRLMSSLDEIPPPPPMPPLITAESGHGPPAPTPIPLPSKTSPKFKLPSGIPHPPPLTGPISPPPHLPPLITTESGYGLPPIHLISSLNELPPSPPMPPFITTVSGHGPPAPTPIPSPNKNSLTFELLNGIPHPPSLTGPIPPPPPPPSLGNLPLPFPIPPVGGWSSTKSMLNKHAVTPKLPMKPLYWTRIIVPCVPQVESISKPIWTQIEELPLGNMSEFSSLFSRQIIQRTVTKKKIETKTKIEPVKMLDSKRSQNVGILAQSLHVDFAEIENAIYTFDTSVVSLEALQQIYEVRATQEELQQIQHHLEKRPEIPLDKPEQFLYDLSEISNFPERISCMMLQIEFEDSITNIANTLTNIKSICDFLTHNHSLIKILSIILTLGNYMNGGNVSRGQADGYGLEILSKLKDVKSNDAQVTLLHFIVRTFMNEFDYILLIEMPLPVPDPEDIRKAASVNFDEISANLHVLDKNLRACESKIKKVLETATEDNIEPFQEKMNTFVHNAKDELITQLENLENGKTKFVSTMKMYQFKSKAESIEATSPSDFFDLWYLFCRDFKDIWKKELIQREKDKKYELKLKEAIRKSEVVRVDLKPNSIKEKIKKLVLEDLN